MQTWKTKKLYEFNNTEIILGQSPSSKSYNSTKQGLPFLQGKAEFGMIFPKPKKFTLSVESVRGEFCNIGFELLAPSSINPSLFVGI